MSSFSLVKNEYKLDGVFLVKINPNFVSVLKQTRSTISYEGLSELMFSIKKRGQKTPGDIFACTKSEAILYLQEENNLWNSNYKIEDFDSHFILEKMDYFYFFLVAGHRRFKACEEMGENYLAYVHFDKTFEEAIEWQLEENLHEELPLFDLIRSATNLWILKKTKNSNLTLKEFAKKNVYKSVNWLSNALRFSRLPLSIQEMIKKTDVSKGVAYSIILEFAKLYDFSVSEEKEMSEELLLSLINHCLTHKYNFKKVKEFCEIKREEIRGQQELFALVSEEVNNNSLTAIRRNKTIHMGEAEVYLKVSGVIANQITQKGKQKAENVIKLGNGLNF